MTETRKDVERTEDRTSDLLISEMDRVFDTMLHRGWLRPFHETLPEWLRPSREFDFTAPRIDVIDREDEFLVRAELPGIDRKNLDVTLSGQTLTLKGTRKDEKKEEKEGEFYRSEIAYGEFSRGVYLPEAVDPQGVEAKFADGMLEVHIRKARKAERQRIDVT